MPWLLARPDLRIGIRYLSEPSDRVGYTLTKYPVNAMIWEDLDALASWLDAQSATIMRRLESEAFYPVPVEIDWTGAPVSFNPLESDLIRDLIRPVLRPKQLSLL